MQISGMRLCQGCSHRDWRGCVILRREMLELGERLEFLSQIGHIQMPDAEIHVELPCRNALHMRLEADRQ